MASRTLRPAPLPKPHRGIPADWPLQHAALAPMSPADESARVASLCELRLRIQAIIKPELDKADPETRLDHFDQQMAWFTASGKLPAAEQRKLRPLVEKYAEIKHELVVANLRWVTKVARSHRGSVVSFEDLFQEGVCGLLKAIDRFESSREFRLMTYATWYIREAMQQIRAKHTHTVALSAHDQTLLGQMEELRSKFLHENGRVPAPRELSKQFGRPRSTIESLQAASLPTVSVERSAGEAGLQIVVEDPVRRYHETESVKATVHRLLSALPERERNIVIRRFGIDDGSPDSLDDLGSDLQVSKERIRQIQRQALRRMQLEADRIGAGV
jgi:RNA polymerase primary sigma factor